MSEVQGALGQLQTAIKEMEVNPARSQQCEDLLQVAKSRMPMITQQVDGDRAAVEAGAPQETSAMKELTAFVRALHLEVKQDCLQAASAKPQRQAQPGEAEFNTIDQFLRAHRAASTSSNPACRAMAQSIQTYPDAISRSLDQARTMPSDEQKLKFIRSAARQAESGLGILRTQCR